MCAAVSGSFCKAQCNAVQYGLNVCVHSEAWEHQSQRILVTYRLWRIIYKHKWKPCWPGCQYIFCKVHCSAVCGSFCKALCNAVLSVFIVDCWAWEHDSPWIWVTYKLWIIITNINGSPHDKVPMKYRWGQNISGKEKSPIIIYVVELDQHSWMYRLWLQFSFPLP